MANLNISFARKLLQEFQFHHLFIEELGWSQPSSNKSVSYAVEDQTFTCRQIAQLGGVVVMEVTSSDSTIVPANIRKSLHKEIQKNYHENLLIFVDEKRTQSLWYWVKRESGKQIIREHHYFKGQPGDLFLTKLSSMVIDIGDLDENGDIHVTEVVNRLKNALDIERVIKKFYHEYTEHRVAFTELITGIKDDRDKRWYASIILNRLMFIYFLQGKGFLNKGDFKYLQNKLDESRDNFGKNMFFSKFLTPLFFEGFAKPETNRSKKVQALLGEIKYLNGGLFLRHRIEIENKEIDIPDKAFDNLFKLFQKYSWNLDDTPGGKDDDINPDVLGYIFEKYINQKAFGGYYTRPEITEYLSERTIYKLVLDRVNTKGIPGVIAPVNFKSISDLLMNLDARLCKQLLFDILPFISILDPACGSGAFLVAAMKTLINLYSAVIGRIEFLNDRNLKIWLADIHKKHPSINYFIKKSIITDNLYGVDIMEEAVEIAKLRLFLALVASATSVDELEPLPNIDFNIMAGNSLIGLLKVDEKTFEESLDLVTQSYYHTYTEKLEERNRLVDTYRHAASYAEDLRTLRDNIETKSKEVRTTLDRLLLDAFDKLGIKYEEATWDEKKNKEGKSKKRSLKMDDIRRLKPFHWGFEFSEIIGKRGGFDAIVTNPPWETFQPNAKEFFIEYSDKISKKSMDIKDFEKELSKILKDKSVLSEWLIYHSDYNYLREYFRISFDYKNQVPIIDGKRHGKDVNLYKLFIERCFNLINKTGENGIIVPSGIYTDLGSKRLREMLFEESLITGLFCFENRKEIFENVDRRFKFVVLTYKKGDTTISFPAKFMRHDVAELEHFPGEDNIWLSVDFVKKMAPGSNSIIEFKSDKDIVIAEKMLKYPFIGENICDDWKIEFHREFNMTDDAYLFHKSSVVRSIPLYEGKMIWHFTHELDTPRYFVCENEGRKAIIGQRESDKGQLLGYQKYRIAYRSVASNTNERSLIATIIPPAFTGNSLNVCETITGMKAIFITAILDSFVLDWLLRLKVTTNINMFYIYQLPVPRLTIGDKWCKAIVDRAARLICTTPEFDDLAKEVGLKSHKDGVTDPNERAKLRAELDGIIANLYELTEEEFTYILTMFPIVTQPVKDAALEQYKFFAPKSADEEILSQIEAGESHLIEFKETARWDVRNNKQDKIIEKVILDSVAAFLNTDGGTLLIGVKDTGEIGGLDKDYRLFGKKDAHRDAYENWLVQYLLNNYQKDIASCLKVTFHQLDGKDICCVTIKPAPRPVYIKDGNSEQFFIRTGNSKKQLSTSEVVQYCKQHWPS